MKIISKILSIIVGLTVINVWLFRSGKATSYRGGNASSLMEEFEVYGLSDYFIAIGVEAQVFTMDPIEAIKASKKLLLNSYV